MQSGFKKLDLQNCSSLSTKSSNFDSKEWDEWLEIIRRFFNSYKVATILQDKPLGDTRPYVEIKINDITASGLLDSGSVVTIIGNNAHESLLSHGLKLVTGEKMSVIAAGGQSLHSIGHINLPITFDGQFHIIKTYVVPGVESSLILGVDFWRAFNLCVKYLGTLKVTKFPLYDLSKSKSPETLIYAYDNLDDSQKAIADNVVNQFKDISFDHKGLGRTHLITHRIDTGDTLPIRQRYYRLSPEKQRILVEQVDEMLALDVVEPCESAWQSPVLLVTKKNGQPRFCLDSRKLNSVTKRDAYNLPYISEILDNLRDARFLSSLDLSKAFWQIPVAEEDRDKTAFYVPSRGTLRFKTTPFGLTNAPSTQQRLVDSLLGDVDHRIFAYLDDIVIVSSNFEEHVSCLLRVLEKLRKANLTINLDKCEFFRSKLKYLGYVVDSNGLRTDPDKVEAILNYATPTNRKELKRFLGTATWYRRFVPNFSTIAGPLNKLTSGRKNCPAFQWTTEADDAFKKLKECLVSAPVLSCPNYDLPFEVHTDASNYGVGAMLTQSVDGKEHPIAYMSRSLTAAEKNYSITERETLAVLVALEHWRCYLENGKTFTVYTDHSAIKWFISLNNPTGRLARWGVRLSSFDFTIKHRRGVDNIIPDALSRAVPVAAIITAKSFATSSDDWYKNIFNNCRTTPALFPNFQVNNDTLYRLSKNKCQLTNEFSWKEVVPAELRDEVLANNHSEPTAGHLGIFKTYRRIALRYYWPGMYRDVAKYVGSCSTCLQYKAQNHATLGEMGRPKHCSRPYQMISIDLMGPLPVTRKQNGHILVITCCFSKFCHIFPIKKATSEVIIKILEEQIFLIHGVPQTIFLDNGSQFISSQTDALFKKYRIPNVFFSPKYTPQVNTVERYNKTIITCISTFVDSDHRSWDTFIPSVQFAINNSVNEATGYTPSFLVFGRELVVCGSHFADNDLGDEILFLPRDIYAENIGYLAFIFDKVQKTLFHAHAKNSANYNMRRKPFEFNVGDIVYKRAYVLSNKDKYFSKKLAPKYIKCKVIQKRSPLVYILEDMSGKNLGTWHIKDLKIYGQYST